MNVRHYITDGIAVFRSLQILNFSTSRKIEMFVLEDNTVVSAHLGKNANRVFQDVTVPKLPTVQQVQSGNYFYWYTFPLMNYYHTINDGLGPIARYFELRERIPDLQFILNPDARKIGSHPPFVQELLELFDIPWQYSDEHSRYECVYFSDTMVQTPDGKRCRPQPGVYSMIERLVAVAQQRYPDVPTADSVYLSRRIHANPRYRKDILGEDNTVKRAIVNEDSVVDALQQLGYTEVFGENYTLGEKISMFSRMQRYISTAGAGVTNLLWRINEPLSVGGVHSPGFPFPGQNHNRHIVCGSPWMDQCRILLYDGTVSFVDPTRGAVTYNAPWQIDNISQFTEWAKQI